MMDEIKPGDIFEVQVITETATGGRDSTGGRGAYVTIGKSTYWLSAEVLLAGRRVASPLGIGDRVKTKNDHWTGEIIVIHQNGAGSPMAGLLNDNGSYSWANLSMLERAPAPDTKEGTS